MNIGLILVIIAAVLLGVAGLYSLTDGTNGHIFPACLAFGAALGFVGVKVP